MQKILFVEQEKCTGCRLCEIACSIHHEKVSNPARARIHIAKWENSGLYVPKILKCDLCNGDPICVKYCVPGALLFIDANATNLRKRRLAAEKISDLITKVLDLTK